MDDTNTGSQSESNLQDVTLTSPALLFQHGETHSRATHQRVEEQTLTRFGLSGFRFLVRRPITAHQYVFHCQHNDGRTFVVPA